MVRAFSHPDPAIARLVCHAIQNAGIESLVRGDVYGAAMGELPPVAAWAEVWIADDARLTEATALAHASMTDTPANAAAPWTCACGETLEGSFGTCWQCGAPAPPTEV